MTHIYLLLRRIAAFLYDTLLLFSVLFMATGVLVYANNNRSMDSWSYRVFLLAVTGIFFCWFWKKGGQTLGMRAWRIKLVNNDASDLSWRTCVLRFVSGLCLFGVTYVYAVFDRQNRTLHDRLSKTQIIRHKN